MTSVAVVVPVRNRLPLTRQCVDALVSVLGNRDDVELVVVDDGSTDETAAFLDALGVEVVRHAAMEGFAASCNDGAGATRADTVVFLNNDTVGEGDWLDALLEYAAAEERAAIVGAKLVYPNRAIQHAGIVIGADFLPRHVYRGFPEDHPAVSRSRRFQAVTAACMLVRRGVFEEVGGFEVGFLNGFEDIDFCLRVGELGGETHYCANSVLVHLEAATRGEDPELFHRNAEHYLQRWGERARRDDVETYMEDGLLELVPGDLYPLELRVDPRLATMADCDVYDLLEERSRQVLELLKENAALRVRLGDVDDSDVPPEIRERSRELRPFDGHPP